eukprot:SAG22_NODE_30_length_28348_cov_12.488584_13_plen_233_part_00
MQLTNVTVGVPKESFPGETRVCLVPDNVKTLVKKGAKVQIESGAGVLAGYSDGLYESAGATIVDSKKVWKSDVVAKVRTPTAEEAAALENRHLIAQLMARQNPELVDQLAGQGASVLALDMLLRTLSRGQAFDVLSSQANIAGYRAVVEAAATIQRPFAGSMTPAGRVAPAKVRVRPTNIECLSARDSTAPPPLCCAAVRSAYRASFCGVSPRSSSSAPASLGSQQSSKRRI